MAQNATTVQPTDTPPSASPNGTADNPLRKGLRMSRTPQPCVLIIFGASGDLTNRKLLPALWALSETQQLGPGFSVVGISRTKKTHDEFRQELRDALDDESLNDNPAFDQFLQGLFYLPGNINDPAMYEELNAFLHKLDDERGTGGNRVYYLSTQPSFFPIVIHHLGEAGMVSRQTEGSGWTRIVIEKPFGRDLKTAHELNQDVLKVFDEQQVYRIYHYLGK